MIITKNEPFTTEEIVKKNKIALESLSMDLKRVALGYNRGSDRMAERFSEEAKKRKDEINVDDVSLYIKKLLSSLDKILNGDNKTIISENALMYSTLFQNYSRSL